MALATLAAAIAPAVIKAGVGFAASKAASKLSGAGSSTSALDRFQAPGINAGGLTAITDPSGVNVTSSAERRNLVGNLARTFPELAAQTRSLREQVTPGFGRLTSSRLGEIESARQRSIGNLRENLQRRRVLGSSFASDALARSEAEFAQQAERVQSESFLQELQLNEQLLQREFAARQGEFTTQLDELNLEANLAAKLATGATAAFAKNAQIKAILDSKEAGAAGKFFGQTFQPVIDAAGSAAGSFFNRSAIGSRLAASTTSTPGA